MSIVQHLDDNYWHDLALYHPRTAQYRQALLDQFRPLLRPALTGTYWHRPVLDLIAVIDRCGTTQMNCTELDEHSEQLSRSLAGRTHAVRTGAEPDPFFGHVTAAQAFVSIARIRGDLVGISAQWEIGSRATARALFRASGVGEPAVEALADLVGVVDSGVLYHALRYVSGRPDAPRWLTEFVTGWARTQCIPTADTEDIVRELLLTEGKQPFTSAQEDIVVVLLGDGLPADDIVAAARALA